MKKYILTENTKKMWDTTLHQIQAVKSFSDIEKGELGGWIEKEANLSHEGKAWVYDDALVLNNALVCGNAHIHGDVGVGHNAWIYGNATVFERVQVYDNARIYGNARVYGGALVHGDARIYGNARICSDARICGKAEIDTNKRVVWIGSTGNKDNMLTAYVTAKKEIEIAQYGFTGSLDTFEGMVREYSSYTAYEEEYLALINFIKLKFKKYVK